MGIFGRREEPIKLGSKARDKITGFVGIVTGRASFLTGCDRYDVQPMIDDKGDYKESRWFDANRLEVLEAAAVKVETVSGPAPG